MSWCFRWWHIVGRKLWYRPALLVGDVTNVKSIGFNHVLMWNISLCKYVNIVDTNSNGKLFLSDSIYIWGTVMPFKETLTRMYSKHAHEGTPKIVLARLQYTLPVTNTSTSSSYPSPTNNNLFWLQKESLSALELLLLVLCLRRY